MRKRRKIYTLLLATMAVVLHFSACQPTPESEAVVNKSDGALETMAKQTAQRTDEAAPSADDRIIWNETKTVNFEDQGEYTVTVNMDVKMPDIPKHVPVYQIKPKEFSMDFIKKTAEYLMKGEIFDGKASKEDVEKEILAFEKDISAHTIPAEYQEQADSYRELLNKKYEDAAEGNSVAKYELSDKEYGEPLLHIKSYSNENSILDLWANGIVKTGFIDHFRFRNNRFNKSFLNLSEIAGKETQPKDIATSYDDALAMANKMMTTLFVEPFAMAHSEVTDLINDNEYYWNDKEQTSEDQAYVFYYMREYDSFPSLYIDAAPAVVTDSTEYAAPYYREGAAVVVDDSGISYLWYDSYSETSDQLNDDVSLLPFADVLKRFKDGIFYHNLWGFPGSTAQIHITGIEFGMVREPVKDQPDHYMMVPAWNFVGTMGNSDLGDVKLREKSMLTLSAIDGSIVTDYAQMCYPK